MDHVGSWAYVTLPVRMARVLSTSEAGLEAGVVLGQHVERRPANLVLEARFRPDERQ
jgi:hypothetical protein